jgi:hypothetical protein
VNLVLPRILTAVGVASLLAACGSSTGTGTVPSATGGTLTNQQSASQPASATRTVASHRTKTPALSANPASLAFADGDTGAQTVTITSKTSGKYAVTIAGTGNCPTVSPATLTLKHADEEGNHDGDHQHVDSNTGTATITVTPAGVGPATCTITVGKAVSKRDRKSLDDNDEHENENDNEHGGTPSLTIPVTVAAPATPSPSPTATATAVPTPSPTPTGRGGR